ncbi:MAG TPA: DUF3089 domain-containing protein [Solirubrobacteraceae bacterium]|jgi:hypothetical protein
MRSLSAAVFTIAVLLALPGAADARVKWLCSPGQKDVCDASLTTTVFSPTRDRLGVQRPGRAARKIDCFYVYPTVSDQPTEYANKRVDPEIRSIALYQAARFNQVCRVFAPVYRQRTVASIGAPSGPRGARTRDIAQADVREAWRAYLRRHNKGRGVVLIGHSQGTFRLRDLIKSDIDGGGRVQRRIVSALLLGGNVVEGEFNGFLPCRSARQLGCVVAFSTYDETPPPDSLFGRSPTGSKVVCTNPARLLGGPAVVETVYPSEPFAPGTLIATGITLLGVQQPTAATPWVATRAYRARCAREARASFLKITPVGGAPDFTPSPTPQWGLHLTDANIALGDLVRLVRRQAEAYAARRGR